MSDINSQSYNFNSNPLNETFLQTTSYDNLFQSRLPDLSFNTPFLPFDHQYMTSSLWNINTTASDGTSNLRDTPKPPPGFDLPNDNN